MENETFLAKRVYFSQVSNTAIRDKNLLPKAKALYCIIQSFVTIENFVLHKNYLQEFYGEGIKSFNNAWKELKIKGYLIQYKYKNKLGKFYYVYDLLDIPKIREPLIALDTSQTSLLEGVDNVGGTKGGMYSNTNFNNTKEKNEEEEYHLPLHVENINNLDKNKEVYKTYFENTGSKLITADYKMLNKLVTRSGIDIVIKAIETTYVHHGAIAFMNYLLGVLKDWTSKGANTLELVDAIINKHKFNIQKINDNKENAIDSIAAKHMVNRGIEATMDELARVGMMD